MAELSLCFFGAILIVGFVFLVNAVKIVPEYQRLVIFRLGRSVGPKGPGIVIMIPVIDKAVAVDLREQVREVQHQTSITKDNLPISIDFLWYYKVLDPAEAVLRVGNFETTVAGIATTALRVVIGDIQFGDVLSEREHINNTLRTRLNEATEGWGVQVTNVEIREIIPPREVQEAITRKSAKEITDANLVVGTIGEAQTMVHTSGTIVLGNQTWDAVSDHPIAPKSKVRLKRVVLEVEDT